MSHSETRVSAARRLDSRGQVCPYNLVLTQKAFTQLDDGDCLEVTIDHPASLKTIPRWARSQGHRVISVQETAKAEWTIVLEKRTRFHPPKEE